MEGKIKYSGAADKNREKQLKLLKKEAGKCKNISDMIYHKSSCSREIPVDQVIKAVINDPSFENNNDQVIQADNNEKIPVDQVLKAVINDPSFENDNDQVIQPDNSESQSISILKDIGLLSLKRMQDATVVPQDAFEKLSKMYGFSQEKVRSEYMVFKQILNDLDHKLLKNLPKCLYNTTDDENSNSDESDEEVEFDSVINMGSLINIFQIINKTNLKPEFENLYSIIKICLTLPTSSCSVECSFSKLKIIKSRLRSTMDQKRLENLIILM